MFICQKFKWYCLCSLMLKVVIVLFILHFINTLIRLIMKVIQTHLKGNLNFKVP